MEFIQFTDERTNHVKKGSKQEMNGTYIAVIALSIINIVIAVINLVTNGRTDKITEQIDILNKKIGEIECRFEGECDVICQLEQKHSNLKRNAERTHLMALTTYNAFRNNEEACKHARKALEEAGEREESELLK